MKRMKNAERTAPRLFRAGLLLAFLFPPMLTPQAIDAFQNPPGLGWKRIHTPHYEIVFPRQLSEDGLRAANTLEFLNGPLNRNPNGREHRYTILLTNQGAVANGYVTLAPRRSEWFHMPPQGNFTGSGEWYQLLASHEGRHMVQFDMANSGFTRIAGWLAGETGILALSMFSIPLWWWEGDAVGMETAMTRNGRGRIPEFGMRLRTQALNGIRFSYPKAVCGSYRDWTPNHYELGYALVSHVRQECGAAAWSRVIRRTSALSFWPFSFSLALKKETGKSAAGVYLDALFELEKAWRLRTAGMRFTPVRILSPESPAWTNYLFPQYLNDSTVVAQKYGFDAPWCLAAVDRQGRERILRQIWPLEPGGTRCSAAAGRIAWDEAVPDLRWGARSHSSIMVMDVRTGKTRRVADRSRYFNPALSPDGGRIAAVEWDTDRSCGLVVLDAETGRVLSRAPAPEHTLFQNPSWSKDGTRIAFTYQDFRGKGAAVLNPGSGSIRNVIPPRTESISCPVLFDSFLVFSSPISGIDNIHAVNLETGAEIRLTSVPYGAFAPQVSADGRRLLFAAYSARGMSIGEADFDPSRPVPADSGATDPAGFSRALAVQEGGPKLDGSDIPRVRYPVRDYRPLANALNVHSWIPVLRSPEFGLIFKSTDVLNTTVLSFGPLFNTNEGKAGMEASAAYAGLFPVIEFGIRRVTRSARIADDLGTAREDSWNESEATLGLSVPLDLSRGIHQVQVRAGVAASITAVSGKRFPDMTEPSNGSLIPVHAFFEIRRETDGSIRDMAPRWGQVLRLDLRRTPFRGGTQGSQWTARATGYFPGLAPHHGIRLLAAWESQKPGNYIFPSSFPFSAGYPARFHEKLAHVSLSYSFPMAYPDLSVGSLLYWKRAKGRVFFDDTEGMDGGIRRSYRSAGAELGFETHFFNLPYPVNLGVRWAHRFEDGENTVGPIVYLDM
jgi:hypothetical protein